MSFKKLSERRVWRTLTWVSLDEAGAELEHSLEVLLRIPAPREFASLISALEQIESSLFLAPEKVVPLVERICAGWRGYMGENGQDVAFEPAEIADLFGNAGVMSALINAYALAYASLFEARRKNSEASASGGHAQTPNPSMPPLPVPPLSTPATPAMPVTPPTLNA
jgi:hypothetical protein